MDFACASASGTTEAFCPIETDAITAISTKTTTGNTTGKANNHDPGCTSTTNTTGDVAYSLQLPVTVASLQIDTNGSAIDTTLMVKSVDCGTELFCDDDSGDSTQSLLDLTNVAPGVYAIVVDGYSSTDGAYTLNVQGTVSQGTRCDSPLFSGGANAVLLCPAGTTCQGSPATCSP
jgi:hypothetical protein